FTPDQLRAFCIDVYSNLQHSNTYFTDPMKELFFYMKQYDWLYNYRSREGLTRSVNGICKRYPILGESTHALELIERHFDEFRALYSDFFPELHAHVEELKWQWLPNHTFESSD
ncbi:MAG TPA: ACP phosphodiesterase, partial [Chitinophagaceae bacterium]|nr:ACP phosphodiesterase [Chitinophagaceae bacterium]